MSEKTWNIRMWKGSEGSFSPLEVEVSAESESAALKFGERLLGIEGGVLPAQAELSSRVLPCGHPEGCRIEHPIHEDSSACGWCWIEDCLTSVQEEWDNAERRISKLQESLAAALLLIPPQLPETAAHELWKKHEASLVEIDSAICRHFTVDAHGDGWGGAGRARVLALAVERDARELKEATVNRQ